MPKLNTVALQIRPYVDGVPGTPLKSAANISWTNPLSEVSTVTFNYSKAIDGSLDRHAEIALEQFNPVTQRWFEPNKSRLWLNGSDGADTDAFGITTVTSVSKQESALGKMPVLVPAGSSGAGTSSEEKRIFIGHPGQIIYTMITEGQATFDVAEWMTLGFSATHDSLGVAWNSVYTQSMEFSFGDYVLPTLRSWVDSGYLYYTTLGNALHIMQAEPGTDRATADGIFIGALAQEKSVTDDNSDLATHVIVDMDDASVVVPIPGAVATRGRLYASVSAPGVEESQATIIGEAEAARRKAGVRERVITESAQTATHIPNVDYVVGDYVWAAFSGSWVRLRIEQIQIRQDDGECYFDLQFEGAIRNKLIDLLKKSDKSTVAGRGSQPGLPSGGGGAGNGGTYQATIQDPITGILGLTRFKLDLGDDTVLQGLNSSVVQGALSVGSRVFVTPVMNGGDNVSWMIDSFIGAPAVIPPPFTAAPTTTLVAYDTAIYGVVGESYDEEAGWVMLMGAYSGTGSVSLAYTLTASHRPILNQVAMVSSSPGGSTARSALISQAGAVSANNTTHSGAYLNGYAFNNLQTTMQSVYTNGNVVVNKDPDGLCNMSGAARGTGFGMNVAYVPMDARFRPSSTIRPGVWRTDQTTTESYIKSDGNWKLVSNIAGTLGAPINAIWEAHDSTLVWNDVVLANGYIHGDGSAGSYYQPRLQYARSGSNKRVIVKGLAYGGVAGLYAGTLPAGVRPAQRTVMVAPIAITDTAGTGTANDRGLGNAYIEPDGKIYTGTPASGFLRAAWANYIMFPLAA